MKEFDELQKINRGKIAFRTLILTLALIFLNGIFKEIYGVWAPSIIESVILFTIPILYFTTLAIFKDAYTFASNKWIKMEIITSIFTALMNLFAIINSIHFGNFKIIEEGKLTYDLSQVVAFILFGYTAIILIIKYIMNKKSK